MIRSKAFVNESTADLISIYNLISIIDAFYFILIFMRVFRALSRVLVDVSHRTPKVHKSGRGHRTRRRKDIYHFYFCHRFYSRYLFFIPEYLCL